MFGLDKSESLMRGRDREENLPLISTGQKGPLPKNRKITRERQMKVRMRREEDTKLLKKYRTKQMKNKHQQTHEHRERIENEIFE